MVHPALLRSFAGLESAAGRSPLNRLAWKPLGAAKRLFGRWKPKAGTGYRPELHYMRGGQTTGAKSLAAG